MGFAGLGAFEPILSTCPTFYDVGARAATAPTTLRAFPWAVAMGCCWILVGSVLWALFRVWYMIGTCWGPD